MVTHLLNHLWFKPPRQARKPPAFREEATGISWVDEPQPPLNQPSDICFTAALKILMFAKVVSHASRAAPVRWTGVLGTSNSPQTYYRKEEESFLF